MSHPSTDEILGKLAGLRSAIRRMVAFAGANWTACALFGFVAITLAFDYGFWLLLWKQGGLKTAYRATLSGACSLAVLWVVWRYLIRPLTVTLPDDDLALRVEHHHPELADRLISTVQFARGSATAPGRSDSRELVDHVIRETGRAAAAIDFSDGLDTERLKHRLVLGFTAVAMVAGLWSVPAEREDDPRLMEVWFRRNVLFQDTPYPGFRSEKPRFRMVAAAGENGTGRWRRIGAEHFGVLGDSAFDLVVKVEPAEPDDREAILPDTVALRLEGEQYEIPLERGTDGLFRHQFARVTREQSFRLAGSTVQSGDVTSPPYRIEVESPPALKTWKITAVPPAYSGLRPVEFTDATGDITVDSEGVLILSAESDQAVTAVRMTLAPRKGDEAADGPTAPAGAPASAAAEAVASSKEIKSEPKFDAEVATARSGPHTLTVGLTDARGYANDEALRGIRISVRNKDAPPAITLLHPGTGQKITPQAVVRLEMHAEDDRGFLGRNPLDADSPGRPAAGLSFRMVEFGGDAAVSATIGLGGGTARRVPLPDGLMPDLDKRPLSVLVPEDPAHPGGKLRWTWAPNFGTGEQRQLLNPGDVFELRAVVPDNHRRPKPVELFRVAGFAAGTDVLSYRAPAECASEQIRFQVVEPQVLLELLLERRKGELTRLKRLREQQEDLLAFSLKWKDVVKLGGGGRPDTKLLDAMASRAEQQRKLADALARIGETVQAVHAELETNRLGTQDERNRLLDRVVVPLLCLGNGTLRARESMAADQWLKDTAEEREAEKKRLAVLFDTLAKDPVKEPAAAGFGPGSLPNEAGAEMAELGAGRLRTGADVTAAVDRAIAGQQATVDRLRKIIVEMQRDVDASMEEIIRMLRERVIRELDKVRRDTERRRLKEIQDSGVFDP